MDVADEIRLDNQLLLTASQALSRRVIVIHREAEALHRQYPVQGAPMLNRATGLNQLAGSLAAAILGILKAAADCADIPLADKARLACQPLLATLRDVQAAAEELASTLPGLVPAEINHPTNEETKGTLQN